MNGAILGFNLACWSVGCFSAPGGQKSLEDLAATKASWLAVVQTRYMDSSTGRMLDKQATDEADIRAEIRRAKSLGLKVALKPHVDSQDGVYRGRIDPADKKTWWKEYDDYILGYARIAQEEKADLFVVGTELATMANPVQARRWKDLIARVRGAYRGPLTYAANWYAYPLAPFWGELDYIGVDAYFPHVPKTGWRMWMAPLAAQALASGKPVLFTEFGCSSQKDANLMPWEWKRLGAVDMDVQREYYRTFLDAFLPERWVAGVLFWGWDIDPDAGGPGSYDMTVQGKPAKDLLERLFDERRRAPLAPVGLSASARAALVQRTEAAISRSSSAQMR